jgi:ribosomal protein S18 acetylase RimI-like enzyme
MMADELIPASVEDKAWLERLRRDVYQELFKATFGGWDEGRHVRQFKECWERGHISIIKVDTSRVGMIQLFEQGGALDVGEIQIQPSHQSQGIGSRILKDTIAQAHKQGKKVTLSVGLKNDRALQLYQRLGFRKVAQSETHQHMVFDLQI